MVINHRSVNSKEKSDKTKPTTTMTHSEQSMKHQTIKNISQNVSPSASVVSAFGGKVGFCFKDVHPINMP